MKMVPDALSIVENESGSAKHENGTQRLRYRRKRVRERKIRKHDQTLSVTPKMTPGAQNIKMGPYTPCITENKSGSVKHEN
jgi:hypothetical protein